MSKIKYLDETYPKLLKNIIKGNTHKSINSNDNILVKCPCCGNEYYVGIYNFVIHKGNCCIICKDGFSYPEKYVANLLKQLNIAYKYQFCPEWSNKKYRYDFEFIHNDDKYIIEVDGGIGHGNDKFYVECIKTDMNAEKSLMIDNIKDSLAIEHGYIVIRMDANYNGLGGRSNHIKQSIINSIGDVFDLSKIDWETCDLFSQSSMFKSVINYYNTKSKFLVDISRELNLSICTVQNYLKKAKELGIITYEHLIKDHKYTEELKSKGVKLIGDEYDPKKKYFYCYDDCILFTGLKYVADYYGIGLDSASLCIRKFEHIKGKHIVKFEDVPFDFDFKPVYSRKARNNKFYQYSKDKKTLINIYENRKSLPKEFQYSGIIDVCEGKRNISYGYFWSYTPL